MKEAAMVGSFAAAEAFLGAQGRLLERLRWAVAFRGAPNTQVAALLRAYQNADGGLGYALEPDLQCAASQPLFCEVGLEIAHEVGWRDDAWLQGICDFLSGVADADGLVGPILGSALSEPRAGHWTEPWPAGLNPTASICGGLHALAMSHPWLTRASSACVDRLLAEPPTDAHGLLCCARLAEHLPDRALGERLRDRIGAALPEASFFKARAGANGYGLAPWVFAPRPDAFMASVFGSAVVADPMASHLAALAAGQGADGGWTPAWEPPGSASRAAWSGVLTLQAVRTLVAYGAMPVAGSE
jgi:hypothetical protein